MLGRDSLGARVVSDYISLSVNAGIAKLQAPEMFVGVTIGDLVGYRSQKINVLVIRRGNNLINLPSFQEVIQAGDELVVILFFEHPAEAVPGGGRPASFGPVDRGLG